MSSPAPEHAVPSRDWRPPRPSSRARLLGAGRRDRHAGPVRAREPKAVATRRSPTCGAQPTSSTRSSCSPTRTGANPEPMLTAAGTGLGSRPEARRERTWPSPTSATPRGHRRRQRRHGRWAARLPRPCASAASPPSPRHPSPRAASSASARSPTRKTSAPAARTAPMRDDFHAASCRAPDSCAAGAADRARNSGRPRRRPPTSARSRFGR